jgi:hypothetical protein
MKSNALSYGRGNQTVMADASESLQLALIYLQDTQRIIAAGKVQRWEVLKWAVTVNLAFAAAGAATKIGAWPLFGLFSFCVLVAITSMFLLNHYNNRITGARGANSGHSVTASLSIRQQDGQSCIRQDVLGCPPKYPLPHSALRVGTLD